jgi:hypothetical protein
MSSVHCCVSAAWHCEALCGMLWLLRLPARPAWPPSSITCRFPRTATPASLQAVEAKEGLPLTAEMRISATISYQALFGYYAKLAGMTVRAMHAVS